MKMIKSVSVVATLALCSAGGFACAGEDDFVFYSELARDWYEAGSYFEWRSTTENNDGAVVDVHYRTFGDPADPQLLLVHGYPRSSFDYEEMIVFLQDEFYIATLDFPGFGFSEKPQNDYSYMLEDDARLLDYFVREIVEFNDFAMFTHDRGVSVGLAFLGHYLDEERLYTINYHFLSNSGMFLPLANLLPGQRVLLDPVRGPAAIAELKSRPRQTEGDPESLAYADIAAFNDGIGARLHVGKYLLERIANEYRWLDNLPRSPIPVAYVWGALDPVNPLRIANHVWATYLNEREVESSYWILPTASHYPQRDRPAELAKIVKLALSGGIPSREEGDAFMWTWNRQRSEHDAIFVGHSTIEALEFEGTVEYTPQGYRN